MKRLAFCVALVLAAFSISLAQTSERTVLKSITVGTPGGRLLEATDLVSGVTYPKGKWFGWTEDSEITTEFKRSAPAAPKLPASDDSAVTYGKVPSRNEFGINEGWYPSPDGSLLAVYRVDESAVGEFPLLDINSRTGSLKSVRYPMNGMSSERVDLCVCDTLGNVLSTLQVDEYTPERYIAGVSWTPDSRQLLVQVLDRRQHDLKLNLYEVSDGSFVSTLLTEHNDAWVEPREGVSFVEGTPFFVYTTDNRDGYRQLYLCDLGGGMLRLTGCDADVTYVGSSNGYIYYTSAEVSPVENHLYRIKFSFPKRRRAPKLAMLRLGKPERLTEASGWHDVVMSPDGCRFIDFSSAVDQPGKVELRSSNGKLESTLHFNQAPLTDFAPVTVEMGTVPSADPDYVNYYRLVKPAGFDPEAKYPVIVYVYGGPHSQMVQDRWLGLIRPWELMMAQHGYVLYIQDNRGTDNRGAKFARAINRRCGKAETADQVKGLEQLIAEGWVDTARIGVVGWSYGGFMTLTMMTSHPELFKAAVAGGPVIDWKWYEVMYGER